MTTPAIAALAAAVGIGAGWNAYLLVRLQARRTRRALLSLLALTLLPLSSLDGAGATVAAGALGGLLFPASIEASWGPRGDGSFPGPIAFVKLLCIDTWRTPGAEQA